MVQTPIKSIDLHTFLKLPETKSAGEFIDDRIIQEPIPLDSIASTRLKTSPILIGG